MLAVFVTCTQVPGNILDAYPDNDLVSVARIGLAFVVTFSYPIQAFVFRISFRSLVEVTGLVQPVQPSSPSDVRTWSVEQSRSIFNYVKGPFEDDQVLLLGTSVFLVLTAIVGFTVRDLGLVVDLSGATGATTLALIAPGFLYFFTFPEPAYTYKRRASLFVAILGVVFLVLGISLALLDAVDPDAVEGTADTHH